MKLGVVFPQTEIGADPGGVAAFAQAAEDLGYEHIAAFDAVIGANVESKPNFTGPYTHESMFYESMVLFGYLAGLTKAIVLATGVLILPQRQTVPAPKHGGTNIRPGTRWEQATCRFSPWAPDLRALIRTSPRSRK